MKPDFSARGRARVYLLTVLGTLLCIGVAYFVDSFDFATGVWTTGGINNFIIPLVLATPLLHFTLSKMRELAIAHHELMHVAATDSLTSLLNRRAFNAMVDGYLERMERRKTEPVGALLLIDIDHFKDINDSFGHDRGDEALKLIAHSLREAVRDADLVGRMGGEEFGIFLPDSDSGRVATIAERVRAAIQAIVFSPAGQRHQISASVGGAVFDRRLTFEELYHVADQRLYAAKREGRNRVDLILLPPDYEPVRGPPLTMH